MSDVIVLAGVHLADLERSIDEGRHPRVDYLEILDATGAQLVDFRTVNERPVLSWFVRRGLVSSYWALALVVSLRCRREDRVLALGEDIGLRVLLLHCLRRRSTRPDMSVIVHGSYLGSRRFTRLIRLLGPRMGHARFLCLSESIRANLVAAGVAPDQTITVGYGVDADFFGPGMAVVDSHSTARPLVAAAGTANRDYRTLVEAVSELDVHAVIAADSAWHREAPNVAPYELPGNVEMRSLGEYSALRDLYRDADLVVVPLSEARRASGYAVILEAMAMGKPVVTTRTSGVGDFVVAGCNCLVVEPGDSHELSNSIAQLLSSEPLASDLGATARLTIEAGYRLNQYVERLIVACGFERRPTG